MTHANTQHLITDIVLTITNDGALYSVRQQSNILSVLDRYIQKNFKKAYLSDRLSAIYKVFEQWDLVLSSDLIAQKFVDLWEEDGTIDVSSVICYQKIRRNNDRNGNAFTLIVVTLKGGKNIGFEERSSMPNFLRNFSYDCGVPELIGIHTSPAEYKLTKARLCKLYTNV